MSPILPLTDGLLLWFADGAREILRAERRQHFADHYLEPMLTEARAVGLTTDSVIEMLRARAREQ